MSESGQNPNASRTLVCQLPPAADIRRIGSGRLRAKDRDRGEPRGSAPPTPPGIRVRTTAVREVALTRIDQGGETERFEVGIGKPDGEGFAPGDVPWATAAVGRIAQLPKTRNAISAARRRRGVFH